MVSQQRSSNRVSSIQTLLAGQASRAEPDSDVASDLDATPELMQRRGPTQLQMSLTTTELEPLCRGPTQCRCPTQRRAPKEQEASNVSTELEPLLKHAPRPDAAPARHCAVLGPDAAPAPDAAAAPETTTSDRGCKRLESKQRSLSKKYTVLADQA